MPTPKQIFWTSLIALAVVAVAFRTPVAPYVTGEKKIAGLV